MSIAHPSGDLRHFVNWLRRRQGLEEDAEVDSEVDSEPGSSQASVPVPRRRL